MESTTTPFLVPRYLAAIMTPLIIASIMQLSWPLLAANPASPYLIAVAVCAWYGGLGPGLLSVLVSILLSNYFFIEPYFSISVANRPDLIDLLTLALVGPVISALGEVHKERRRAEINLNALRSGERTRSAESLREAQARTESVLASIGDAYILFDRQWRYLYVNDAAIRAIGRPREQILGRTLWEVYPDIVGSELDRQCRQAMKDRRFDAFDFHSPTLGRWWEIRFYPAPEGLSVLATEITERKQAEQALRASEARCRELFESARDAIYVHDLNGVYVSVNRAAEKLSGYSRDEIIGKHFTEFVAPVQVDQVRDTLTQKLITQSGASYVVEMIARDGRRVPVEVNSNLIYENGAAVGVQGLVRDITDRISAEQAIRQAQQKFRDIFENAGEGIFQSTPEGQFLAANPALARIHGYESPEELIRSLTDISTQIYVDPKRRDEFRRLLAEKGVVRGFENQVSRKDGSSIWVSVNARAVRDEQDRLLYYEGTVQDITESKSAADRLREYEKVVEGLEEMIVVIDRDYRYLIANRAFLNYRGLKREQLIGHLLPEFVDPKIFEAIKKTGQEFST